ncbi:MAG: ribosome-binding factor A [Candidatus Vogelbacteria bacterium]|nr:ribosome-binding factor A [Candidatus Vogelbacteria bacterium]
MSGPRDKRIESFYMELAARFLEENSAGPTYMITVTGITISKNHQYVTVLFTVMPESYEATALKYARTLRSDFRELVKSQSKMKVIPTFDFDIDKGEKYRQRIDILIQKTK